MLSVTCAGRRVTSRRIVGWHQSGNKVSGKGKKGKKGKKGQGKGNASSSGGGGVHCLTYTDDQSHWIMVLAEVGQNQEQSNNIEFLVDSGAACHAWPFKTKSGSSRGGTF